MKQLFFLLAASLQVFAQTNDLPAGVRLSPPADVPATVLERFRQEYPKANAAWQKSGDGTYAATFNDDSTHLSRRVLYSTTGQQLEVRTRLEKGGYPKMIDHYYLNNFPTDDFALWHQLKKDQPPLYYGIRGSDTTWFGEQGNYLEQMNRHKRKSKLGEKDAALFTDLVGVHQRRLVVARKLAEPSAGLPEGNARLNQAMRLDAEIRVLAIKKSHALPAEEPATANARDTQPTQKLVQERDGLEKKLAKVLERITEKAQDQDLKALAGRYLQK